MYATRRCQKSLWCKIWWVLPREHLLCGWFCTKRYLAAQPVVKEYL